MTPQVFAALCFAFLGGIAMGTFLTVWGAGYIVRLDPGFMFRSLQNMQVPGAPPHGVCPCCNRPELGAAIASPCTHVCPFCTPYMTEEQLRALVSLLARAHDEPG